MKSAIRVENLSKCYRLQGGERAEYKTFRESLTGALTAPLKRLRGGADGSSEFWALRDVSFEVHPGEVVGIIGRNGAGKSTLLKVLSRITKPTSGGVDLRGRVGSLLEVGTGFHPELTGRENIFLNGSILGMSRRDVARRFDEIVAFAEVEKFLDTPVKRYSSGMYVRLAFAVAAHLEPEVLIVDEVLAVGDAEFQKKCLGKMGEVSRSGRTVLFVSHNMTAVKALCSRAVFLSSGSVHLDSTPDAVISKYFLKAYADVETSRSLDGHAGRPSGTRPVMKRVTIKDGAGQPCVGVDAGGTLEVAVHLDCDETRLSPVLGVVVKDQYGTALFGINNRLIPGFRFPVLATRGVVSIRFPQLPLMPGTYSLDLYLGNEFGDVDIVNDAITFHVHPADVFGSGKLPPSMAGPFLVPATWTLATEADGEPSAAVATLEASNAVAQP